MYFPSTFAGFKPIFSKKEAIRSCAKGRSAEDGIIPNRHVLQETESEGYMQRTKWNIHDSDATLIISWKAELIGGSKFTYEYARRIAKPCLHVHPNSKWHE